MVVVYILLFIVMLSLLVMVHELGHFTAAKFFKVYCLEFSIGFGPALIHRKRKNGETYFSLRAIPFGGYVSMYGEGVEVKDPTVVIDPDRAFNKIKKWKRIIILFAGVTCNALLALVIFFVSEFAFTQKAFILNPEEDGLNYNGLITVKENSIASKAGILDQTFLRYERVKTGEVKEEKPVYDDTRLFIDRSATVYYSDYKTDKIAVIFSLKNISFEKNSLDGNLHFYKYIDSPTYEGIDINNELNLASISTFEKVEFTTRILNNLDEKVMSEYKLTLTPSVDEKGNRVVEDCGLCMGVYKYRNNFGKSIEYTFRDFGESATIIFRSIGRLFTDASSWSEIGGIIAIGQSTTDILTTMGWAKFLYYWGLISVNLAIINLLPFPGLDGWQILVLAVEMIAHKEIPEKIKGIVSFVGIALLFALMILILIKDVIGLF